MSEQQWRSAITKIEPNQVRIRGYRVEDLMSKISFSQTIYLLLKGELPPPGQASLIDAMMIASIDHGATTPSSLAARTSASTGAPMNAALGAGILSINRFHGAAIQDCMNLILDGIDRTHTQDISLTQAAGEVLLEYQKANRRIPGLGHRVHSDDPRTKELFHIAERNGLTGNGVEFIRALQEALKAAGKNLPINVDGAIAALLVDMEFPAELGNAFFIMARIPGLTAQVFEEQSRERPMRRIDPEEVGYDGPDERELSIDESS